jgi:hypothetical protein
VFGLEDDPAFALDAGAAAYVLRDPPIASCARWSMQ